MPGYGQFCPVAKAMEVLDERWTLLVVRELLCGSVHFNELRRGVPKMSPALLSKRLRTLARVGVIERRGIGNRVSYHLTARGRELASVVEALGSWGIRWIGELGEADLDPHLLLWDIRRRMDSSRMPRSRTVLQFDFDDVDPKVARWWLVVDATIEICDVDPGFEVTVRIATSLRTMTLLWRGDLAWPMVLRDGQVTLTGPSDARRRVPSWLRGSVFAEVPRPVVERSSRAE